MTRTTKSESPNNIYFLTIDDNTGEAIDCQCPDHQFRHHTCKHMTHFDAALDKALAFAALRQQYDYRSETQREIRRAAYLNFEMSIGVL